MIPQSPLLYPLLYTVIYVLIGILCAYIKWQLAFGRSASNGTWMKNPLFWIIFPIRTIRNNLEIEPRTTFKSAGDQQRDDRFFFFSRIDCWEPDMGGTLVLNIMLWPLFVIWSLVIIIFFLVVLLLLKLICLFFIFLTSLDRYFKFDD